MESLPVFVVGVPRSGTTLLAALLTAHSQFAGGPETQFFSRWRAAGQREILGDSKWPARAVDILATLTGFQCRVHEAFGVSRRDLYEFLAARAPEARALLEALTETIARRANKPRWVEKSPSHLMDAREIRKAFPHASVIRLVRDPRDVSLSLRAVLWGAPSLLANAYRWWSMDRTSAEFFATDERSLTVYYERLLARPEDELRRVCAFLGVEFEPGMLDTRHSSAGLSLPGEWYKEKAGTPVDASRAFAWKRGFPRKDLAALEMICQEKLDAYGYERTAQAKTTHRVYALDAPTVAACEELLCRAAGSGVRFLPFRYENIGGGDPTAWPGPLVFVGDVVPGRAPAQRRRNLGRLARTLFLRRLGGRDSIRLLDVPSDTRPADAVARVARLLLSAGTSKRLSFV